MRLFTESLAEEILAYLKQKGEVPRKSLYIPFAGYTYRYYAKVIQRLLKENYVELIRKNELNHLRLTSKGELLLKRKYRETSRDIDAIPKQKLSNAGMKRRQALVDDMEWLCVANGFVLSDPDEAMPLAELFRSAVGAAGSVANQSEAEKGTNGSEAQRGMSEAEIVAKLEEGVYYSMKEVRRVYTEIIGENEIANWTRLIGIVIYKRHLTFLYSVQGRLIQWRSGSEERTVKFITNFLMMSDILRRYIQFEQIPSCVICGKGKSMIPKIVTGRKWGKITDDQNKEMYRAVLARDHINSHNLAKVFSAAYYVSVTQKGIGDFRFACMLTDGIKESLCEKWFNSITTATRVQSFGYHQGLTGKGDRVIYMPYIDLIELDFYKRQGIAAHFVIPSGTQEMVSRVMGPLLLSARSLKGVKLKYNLYDEYGAALVENPNWRPGWNKKEKGKKAKAKAERKKSGEETGE